MKIKILCIFRFPFRLFCSSSVFLLSPMSSCLWLPALLLSCLVVDVLWLCLYFALSYVLLFHYCLSFLKFKCLILFVLHSSYLIVCLAFVCLAFICFAFLSNNILIPVHFPAYPQPGFLRYCGAFADHRHNLECISILNFWWSFS